MDPNVIRHSYFPTLSNSPMQRNLFIATFLLGFLGTDTLIAQEKKANRRPNVVIVITDDQGHGDLGFHGNPIIKTPNLDRLARQSLRMKHFFVCPVCSPTRSSLLTGRYNYRTGVVDTFIGRSMMHADEITLAEILRGMGYVTGIFGKWHLGDCFPLRPQDQGFMESLVLKGGGIGQPSDPAGGSSYFDPILQHNGRQVKTTGYCSDVYTDAALRFFAKNKDQPFFCYLPFNAPHDPLQVPEKYLAMYKNLDLSPVFPAKGIGKFDAEKTAKVYGMVTNIDDNMGRILAKLEELGIAENTIVIFLTDNGPQYPRYNSGMRGVKGSVFEGGTRVPFFVRWPAALPKDVDIDRIAAHIDVTPTLVAACGGELPKDRKIDGKNLLPLWRDAKSPWPDRSLFVQWHRGDVPEMGRACAVRTQKYRLVQPEGVAEKGKVFQPKWMLFDIESDPGEKTDLATEKPGVVSEMKKAYEAWFKDVAATRNFAPPRIHVGTDQETTTWLTRQDMRGPKSGWMPGNHGFWEVHVEKAAVFDITVHMLPNVKTGTVKFKLGEASAQLKLPQEANSLRFENVRLSEGQGRLEAWVEVGEDLRGVQFVELRRRD